MYLSRKNCYYTQTRFCKTVPIKILLFNLLILLRLPRSIIIRPLFSSELIDKCVKWENMH